MSKKPSARLALACAGACTILLALPPLAGAGLVTAGAAWLKPNLEIITCGALALTAIALVLWPRLRRKAALAAGEGVSCNADEDCGCRPEATNAK